MKTVSRHPTRGGICVHSQKNGDATAFDGTVMKGGCAEIDPPRLFSFPVAVGLERVPRICPFAIIARTMGTAVSGKHELSHFPRPRPWDFARWISGWGWAPMDRIGRLLKPWMGQPPSPSEVWRFSHGGVDAPISQTYDGMLHNPATISENLFLFNGGPLHMDGIISMEFVVIFL